MTHQWRTKLLRDGMKDNQTPHLIRRLTVALIPASFLPLDKVAAPLESLTAESTQPKRAEIFIIGIRAVTEPL